MLKWTDKKYFSYFLKKPFSFPYRYIIPYDTVEFKRDVTSNQALFKLVVSDSWIIWEWNCNSKFLFSPFLLLFWVYQLRNRLQKCQHSLNIMVSDHQIMLMTTMRYEISRNFNLQVIFRKWRNFFKDVSQRKADKLIARTPTDSESQRKIHQKEQNRRQAIYLRHFLF